MTLFILILAVEKTTPTPTPASSTKDIEHAIKLEEGADDISVSYNVLQLKWFSKIYWQQSDTI